ncbi:MAG: hypothetical protein ABI277_12135 [Burkholderiaceae bacterium]
MTHNARPLAPRAPRLFAAAVAAAALVGCTTAPLSFINDQQVYHKTVLNRYPLVVTAVDGASTAFRPVPIAPGPHLLTMDAAPVAGFSQPVQKVYPMTIAPCTRYYVAAQRTSPLVQDWNLVVEETWPVSGCDAAKELEKAKTAALSGQAAPTSSVIAPAAMPPVAFTTSR